MEDGDAKKNAYHSKGHEYGHAQRQGEQYDAGADRASRGLLHFVAEDANGRFGDGGHKAEDEADQNDDPFLLEGAQQLPHGRPDR